MSPVSGDFLLVKLIQICFVVLNDENNFGRYYL